MTRTWKPTNQKQSTAREMSDWKLRLTQWTSVLEDGASAEGEPATVDEFTEAPGVRQTVATEEKMTSISRSTARIH